MLNDTIEPQAAPTHALSPLAQLRKALLTLLLVCALPAAAQEVQGQNGGPWRINMKNADIQEFVSQIANITGRTFVVDPRVRGNVTVISNASLDEEGIYELFLSVLRVHGFAAIETGDVVRIQQQTLAKQSGDSLDGAAEIDGEQIVTRVIPAQYVDANELVKTLRPLVPQYSHLTAVADPNVVIISDHAENISRLISIIERIDVADDERIESVPLEHAWVGNVVELLEQLAPEQLGRNAAGPQRIQLIANERTNSVILKGKRGPIADVRQLIGQLDQPTTATNATQVLYLSNADATAVAEILNGLITSGTAGGGGENGGAQQPLQIQPDTSLNALVVRADPNTMGEIAEIVDKLDVRRTQVLIEAAIVEVTLDDTFNAGVDVAAADSRGRSVPLISSLLSGQLGPLLTALATANGAGNGGSDGDGDDNGNGNGNGTGNGDIDASSVIGAAGQLQPSSIGGVKIDLDGVSFGVVLQALSRITNANLLSTPSILTLDNQEAKIVVGQNVPFRTGSFTTGNDGADNPFTTIQREDVGLTLTVTPHIHEGRSVRLEVAQEVENVVQSAQGIGPGGFSDIVTNKRTIETTVLADDTQTIVLGGLIQDDITETTSKVPLLGDVPLLGRLFQSNRQTRSKQNLLVFLRPTVIRTEQDAADATARKYSSVWSTEIIGTDPGEAAEPEERDAQAELDSIYDGRKPRERR